MTRIDRRALFTRGAAAALLTATGISLEASPRPGGTLRLAVPRDGSLERVARAAVFDTLTEIAPDGTLRGELATAWTASRDCRSWTFELRPGVCYHDTRPLSDEDAVAVLARLGDADRVAPGRVRLTLDRPDPGLPFRLADDTHVVTRADAPDPPLESAVGTGRYRVGLARSGRHFRAHKVAGHYKDGRAGWAESIEIIAIPDAAVRAEALRDGFVDVAALPAPEALGDTGGLRFFPAQGDMTLAVAAHVGMPRQIGARTPLDDGRIAERWWMS